MAQKNRLFLSVALLVFLVAGVASVQAQVGMRLTAEHQRYLRYEPIELTLTLRNYSGNTLIFGDQDGTRGSLDFIIESQTQRVTAQLDPDVNPIADIILAAGASRELKIILNQLFDMQRNDVYKITAVLEHQRLPQAYVSDVVTLEVREGTVVTERVIGIPVASEREQIRSLKVSLMLFHESYGTIYCLRVEDDEHVYGTFRVGPYISGSKPQLDADGSSAIHVLVQVRPRLYSYAVYGLVGDAVKLRQQRYYKPSGGVPTLSRDPGYLKILNVSPAIEGVDFRTGTENWKPRFQQ